MTLEDLIHRFRIDATDTVPNPYLFADEWITEWLNEAEQEAAIRGRLIYEASDAAVCQIAVTAGTNTYPLHASLYELVAPRFQVTGETRSEPLDLITREELTRTRPDWRNDEDDRPRFIIQDDTRVTLWPVPNQDGKVLLEGYRLPLAQMSSDTDTPEINAAHHRHLVHWALHRAFSRPDSDTIDPTRAGLAEQAFTRYFGLRPDSDLRRATRSDEPQTTKVFWP